ncbi:MAG: 50S ribosomal protein L1 [Kiritimatiellae bacterium]|nr:50S ribosomal protein L1 [Kiritimatiellia bacterium]MDD5522219.1 50S ribosomal protein L1 [Kiritimatiellia bacterium]
MAKYGKKYREVKTKVPEGIVELTEAVKFVKEHPIAKFDETAEIAFRLGVDPKKTEQTVRGTVALPHGTGKKVKILVFAAGAAADAAKTAGADYVGNEDLIEKVKGGWTDFDIAIATPEAMKEVRKLGKVLGPRGLMPNPKTGTVTDDTATAVAQSKAGKVEFRMDRHGNASVPFGKLSFAVEKLVENANSIISGIKGAKPAGFKGVYIKTCTVSSTMGVGLRVNVKD